MRFYSSHIGFWIKNNEALATVWFNIFKVYWQKKKNTPKCRNIRVVSYVGLSLHSHAEVRDQEGGEKGLLLSEPARGHSASFNFGE